MSILRRFFNWLFGRSEKPTVEPYPAPAHWTEKDIRRGRKGGRVLPTQAAPPPPPKPETWGVKLTPIEVQRQVREEALRHGSSKLRSSRNEETKSPTVFYDPLLDPASPLCPLNPLNPLNPVSPLNPINMDSEPHRSHNYGIHGHDHSSSSSSSGYHDFSSPSDHGSSSFDSGSSSDSGFSSFDSSSSF